jgi:glycosyltransferase involved in cell wall biosynthesis/SAM-dependent methyltransferase
MSHRVLIFTATYAEENNIGLLVDQIFDVVPNADVLVVDDNSPDGTWDVIQQRRQIYSRLFAVQRPSKMGIGSAHKYALLYALREKYDILVTMDADFSHQPQAIPALLSEIGPGRFVTGSRYCKGGKSDYTGYRNLVSRAGNIVACTLLNLKLKELTTYFRAFDVASLRSVPLHRLKSEGYSYGVELVYYLRKSGVLLQEIPIHFVDRLHGASKIPKLQIFKSAFDLVKLSLQRLNPKRDLNPDEFVNDPCSSCGDRVLAMKYRSKRGNIETDDSASFKCTSVGARSSPPVYKCLNCGLDQVPASLVPAELELLYEEVVDNEYLKNIEVRRHTFRRCIDRMAPWLPEIPGSMLEVGAYCGLFLKEATGRGWYATGVEPSHWASRYAREVAGMSVHTGFLEENRGKLPKQFDVVVSWDVLEHVRNPVQFIRECGEFLPAGGIFFFSTLDTSNWLPRLLGRGWPWLIDMHIQYFDIQSIRDVLRRAGFELIATQPYTHYAWGRYIVERSARILPSWLKWSASIIIRFVPARLMIPVAFGDIRFYVARKIVPMAVNPTQDLVHA